MITRWAGQVGGQERANYAMFLSELCDVLGVKRPDPASASTEENDYVFERVVKRRATEAGNHGRIDLYKRDCFILEAKQSRQPGEKKDLGQVDLFGMEPSVRGVRSAARGWDVLMLNARRQAEEYARDLPTDHKWPPFILVCDVGHVIETYADFSGQGRNYVQFPDRQSFRIYLNDLRDPAVRQRLATIWTDPWHLDPARHAARVTRDIAERLAAVSKALEDQGYPAEDVAMFLMRCLFTMFACSPGIALLPEGSFRDVLATCEANPDAFPHDVGQLWEAMNTGGWAHALHANVKRFNGEFFRERLALPLGREEIGELRRAASYDWKDVDPSIFGTLLEQALDKTERKRLGAHYTPRAYVERLVVATVIEPLRQNWEQTLGTAERFKTAGQAEKAVAEVRSFHETLCKTRILDPACGTGNFLYVSLELLKRLEGEVLEALVNLGGQEVLSGLGGHTVDPHQFLGLELNPRAAAIAELVLWIGYLQWHFRTRGGEPAEPILRAFHNVQGTFDAVLAADIQLKRDANGKPVTRRDAEGREIECNQYLNPKVPEWPAAEFIVGNPPFIGGKDIRARMGDDYTEALWTAHPAMNDSADFVMYWWDHAASLLIRKGSVLRRFGLVTTNSISQVFQRRVVERHLQAKTPISLLMAIPDHPWTKAARDSAAVRIAMTVAAAGSHEGLLLEVAREEGLDTDTPLIELSTATGVINADLTVGVDVTKAKPLLANEGLSSPGVKLHGSGFIVTPSEAEALGLGKRPGLENHIREYRNGRDLAGRARGVVVIDLFGLDQHTVQQQFPEVYQHLLRTVKPERNQNNRATYRDNWWIFGEPRAEIRPALEDMERYIATVETAKHRIFVFLVGNVLPDNKLIAVALLDAYALGVLSSRFHCIWAIQTGGLLEDRPVYVKSLCFDPFPFPAANDLQKQRIRAIAEDLDAHRKRVLADHPNLTLTGLYNVLEKLRAGTSPDALDPPDRRIFDEGLVLILKDLHDRLDHAVAAAYGWPADLSDTEILTRLVALNQERVKEEAAGTVRWLRPEYQIPRYGSAKDKLDLVGGTMRATEAAAAKGPKPGFPSNERDQTVAVMAELFSAGQALTPTALATRFRQGRRILPQVEAALSALLRVGSLVTTTDGGRSFQARRAA